MTSGFPVYNGIHKKTGWRDHALMAVCGSLLIRDTGPTLAHHSVIFYALDGSAIRAAALRTSGAAGPSGMDAYGWRRLCTVQF